MYRDLTKRILALALSVCMIAGMVDLSGLTVRAADDADNLISIGCEITVDRSSPIEYDGSAKTPNVTVVNQETGATLGQGTDYRLEYDNNTNAGSAGVTVINLKNEADRKRTTFPIAQRDINSGTFPSGADLAQEISSSDMTVTPPVDVTDSGNKDHTNLVGTMSSTTVAGVDYTYVFSNNRGPGTATVKITGRNNYTGTKSIDFTISLLDGKKLTFDVDRGSGDRGKVYTGKDIEPKVSNVKYDGVALTQDDYTVRYANNCYAGEQAEVWIEGKGSRFGGLRSETQYFKITKSLGSSYDQKLNIWAEDIDPQSYRGGAAVELDGATDIKLHDPDYSGKTLELGKDFEISSYANNSNEGTATVTVHGIGCYTGYLDLHYEIIATQLSSLMVDTTGATYVYDGTDQFDKVKAAVVVSNGDIVYKEGVDYTISRKQGDAGTSAGQHKIVVAPTSTGMLTGNAVEVAYNVEQKELSDSRTISIAIVNYTDKEYNGQPKKPEVEIRYKPQGAAEQILRAGQDYDAALSYNNNTNATTDTSKATVWAVGKGNYKGSTAKCEFDIEPIKLTAQNTTITGFTDGQEFAYTGSAIEPNVNVVHSTRGTLRKGTDYTVTYENNTDVGGAGAAEVKIVGTGNYQGEFQKRFTIIQRDLNDSVVSVQVPASVQYTGEQLTPAVTVKHGSKTLTPDTDYTLEYGPNIEKGSGSVKIIGIGNYKGEVNKTFAITARSITSGTLSIRDINHDPVYDFTTGTANDHYYPYTGAQVTFTLEVNYTNAEAGMQDIALEPGVDYDLEFKPGATAIGTAQATIRAKGNYTGSKPVNFTVKGNLADYGNPSAFTSVMIPEQVYTSNPIVPGNAVVTFAGKTLTSKDYDVVCENGDNTDAGIATAKIVGKGDYYGTAEPVAFDIRKFNLSKDDLQANNYVINNVEASYDFCETTVGIQPIPQITHNGNALTQDLHYYVEYGDNNKIGKGSLTIKGDDVNYEGEHRIEFDITPYDLGKGEAAGNVVVQGIEDVILDAVIAGNDVNAEMLENAVIMSNLRVEYTAKGLDGSVVGNRELDFGTEYTISYKDNTKIGEATITINGTGNFGGTITKTFRIRGDLSSDRTEMTVADCDYSPAGNTPEPTVTYTYDNGVKETLTAGVDYAVTYENNTDATVKSGSKARVIISPVMSEDGNTIVGNYAQSGDAKSQEFEIRQRDLTNAIETEGNEKDPALNVTGLIEEGYEYTGLDIIPELVIACNELNLGVGTDYTISAVNNKNVYTFAEGVDGARGERLMPTVMVSAVQDSDGNYTGNYKGGFQMEFKINPREISAETVMTVLRIKGETYDDSRVPEVDFTGEAITFPLDPADPSNTKNDLEVTWSKMGQNTSLVEGQDYNVAYVDNVRIGEAKIAISEVEFSNYKGTYERIFKIMASIEIVDEENPPLRYMTLDYDHNVPFGIVDVYPDMIFEDVSGGEDAEPYILEKDKDFEIVTAANQGTALEVSRNNRNVASETAAEEERPMVVIRGIGCYRGVIKRYYNIIPKNLTTDEGDITITFDGALNSEDYENAFIYTGSAIEPTVKVYNHGQLMEPGVDYTVAGYANNTAISTESRKASVIIRAVDGGNYLGQKTFEFNIIRRPIEGMQAELVGDNPVYNRKARTPEIKVFFMNGTEEVVLTKNDYDVTYENNVNAATQYAGDDAPVAIITGKNAYGGTLTKKFTIEPEPLDESNDDFDITAAAAPYTGMEATTTVTVKAKDGTLLEEETDYMISGYRDNVSAGTGYVTIRGNGNYTGTRDVPFSIIPPDVSEDFRVEDIPEQTFTGKPIEPKVSVSLSVGEGEEEVKIPLTENDYVVEYENNTNAGTATAIVKGAGNFAGEKRVEFKILPKNIGDEEGMDPEMTLADIEDQLYTGKGVTPDVDLRFQSPAAAQAEGQDEDIDGDTGTDSEGRLVLGKDYTLNYLTNVAIGTASVTIVGIGNFSGNIQTTFRILGPMNLAEVPKIPAQPYTGSEVKPVPEVYFAGKKLTEGEEYTLSYADNIAQGTATITITGMGEWYTGEKLVTFEIARDFSNETLIKGLASAYNYTGKAITPSVLVEDHGKILSKGVDYTVSYSSNTNVGSATVTVTGVGKYNGKVTANFKITPQNLGRATVTKIADQTYNGKKLKPTVSISSGGVTLKSGTDYTVSHVDNKNPGKASVIIKGKGNFTGTKTVNYNIVVPKVTGVKVSGYTTSSITFSWKQNKVVTGYEIYNSKNKRVAFVRKNSTLKATVSKLKVGTSAKFRVRAFVRQGQYYYSNFVNITASTAPKATSITSISSKKSKQVALKWKKISKATNYQVYRSTSKKGKYTKIATTSKTSYTDKKATKGKTYYYKIRVCKKVGSKTYNSKYSSVKSVAAKK